MPHIFLIFGYGIPKDILKDENYNFYLKMVFNNIYDLVMSKKIKKPMIICCGGKTDMFKPYKRTEAEEMIRLLNQLTKRPILKDATKDWIFIPEKTSLSTLENLLNSKKLLKEKRIQNPNLYIFCEKTRANRIKIISKKIFDKKNKLNIIPIDFDVSANRYLDPKFLKKKENAELKHMHWALKNPINLKKHHEMFQEKMDYLRNAGPDVHIDAVKKWWEEKLKELEK